MVIRLKRSSPVSLTVTALLLVMWVLITATGTVAQERPEQDMSLVVDPEPPAETTPQPLARPDEKERRVKTAAGMAALAGIVIVGIVLGAVIIIWAGRLRRMIREPLPPTGKQDPFWFLRPSKTSPPETTETDS